MLPRIYYVHVCGQKSITVLFIIYLLLSRNLLRCKIILHFLIILHLVEYFTLNSFKCQAYLPSSVACLYLEFLNFKERVHCTYTPWENLAKFLLLVRARSVSGHLTESGQFFEKGKSFNFSPQVR